MYPHFIEVHQDDMDVSLNVDAIIFLANAKDCKYNCAVKIAGMNSAIGIDESYDELKKLIESSGALIQMGDPRLDTSKPLTWDELRTIDGKPVWATFDNENGTWYIAKVYDDEVVLYEWGQEFGERISGAWDYTPKRWQAYRKERE